MDLNHRVTADVTNTGVLTSDEEVINNRLSDLHLDIAINRRLADLHLDVVTTPNNDDHAALRLSVANTGIPTPKIDEEFIRRVAAVRLDVANTGVPNPNNEDPMALSKKIRSRRKNSRDNKPLSGYGSLKLLISDHTNERDVRVIGKVAGEIWTTISRDDRAAFNALAHRINLRIKRY